MSDFGPAGFAWLIVPVLEFFGNLMINIIIIVIGSIGYKETKGKGWLFFMIYGLIGIMASIPGIFYVVAVRFVPAITYGRIMALYTIIGFLFKLGSAALLIIGLMLLLKDYRVLRDGTGGGL
jgi:hypothetical protein